MSKLIQQFLDDLTPRSRPGRPKIVTACPYCGAHLSQSSHGKHRAGCKASSPNAPKPAGFYEDKGGGYNKDGTFPQT